MKMKITVTTLWLALMLTASAAAPAKAQQRGITQMYEELENYKADERVREEFRVRCKQSLRETAQAMAAKHRLNSLNSGAKDAPRSYSRFEEVGRDRVGIIISISAGDTKIDARHKLCEFAGEFIFNVVKNDDRKSTLLGGLISRFTTTAEMLEQADKHLSELSSLAARSDAPAP